MKTPFRFLATAAAFIACLTFFNGCAGTPTRKSTGEFFDDAATTAKVKAAFAKDPGVSAMAVNVDTFKGTVQLNGFVNTPDEKARAEQIARGVPGVSTVHNNLTVKSAPPR